MIPRSELERQGTELMIQSFKQWFVEEWAKQSPIEKRMIINAVPAMVFIFVIMVMIAAGAQFPLLTLGPIAAVVQAVWSGGYIGFLIWQRWQKARADHQTRSEWREESRTTSFTSHLS